MNLKLISLIFCFASLNVFSVNANKPIDYELSWNGNSDKILIDLYYKAYSDSTIFYFGKPDLGGQDKIFDIIGNVKSDNNDEIQVYAKDRRITIFHKRSMGKQHLQYEIDAHHISHTNSIVNEVFRPLIKSKSFYSLGMNLFLQPADSSQSESTVKWKVYPKEMKYFISTDPNATPQQKQKLKVSEYETILIVMGEDIHKRKNNYNNTSFYTITSSRDTINNMNKELEPFYHLFFPSIQEFWQDHQKSYFISLLPIYQNIPPMETGLGLKNGLSMKYSGIFNKKKQTLLAHEISHNWIGSSLDIEGDGYDNQWFSEGFNDYVCIFNLARVGMFKSHDFLTYLNDENLTLHYSNPVRAASANTIKENFWADRNYEILPYNRGFIFAFYLDNQIRLASGEKYTLRDFLLKFHQQTKNKKKPVVIEDFLIAISSFLPKEQVRKEVQGYMIKGTPIDFRSVKLIKPFRISFDKDSIPRIDAEADVDLQKIYNFNK